MGADRRVARPPVRPLVRALHLLPRPTATRSAAGRRPRLPRREEGRPDGCEPVAVERWPLVPLPIEYGPRGFASGSWRSPRLLQGGVGWLGAGVHAQRVARSVWRAAPGRAQAVHSPVSRGRGHRATHARLGHHERATHARLGHLETPTPPHLSSLAGRFRLTPSGPKTPSKPIPRPGRPQRSPTLSWPH